jgi:acetylornithine/N-succinyldiaminopimelate aminotransferase
MDTLTYNPVLGHITTFGGHPVSCAAGKAALEVLLESNWIEEVKAKENILIDKLKHTSIKKLNVAGLWAAIELQDFETTQQVAHQCVSNGLITDWFLFASSSIRIAPPLCTTEEELKTICEIVLKSLDSI